MAWLMRLAGEPTKGVPLMSSPSQVPVTRLAFDARYPWRVRALSARGKVLIHSASYMHREAAETFLTGLVESAFAAAPAVIWLERLQDDGVTWAAIITRSPYQAPDERLNDRVEGVRLRRVD